jgi:Ca2+-binding RTX toxin-like protein
VSIHGISFDYSGNDVIDAHNDTNSVVIYGGAGDDTIWGSQAGDQIAGGSGNDTIYGQGGDDHIYGDNGINVDEAYVDPRLLPANGDIASVPGLQAQLDAIRAGYRVLSIPVNDAPVADLDPLVSTDKLNPAYVLEPNRDDLSAPGNDIIYGDTGSDIIFGDYGIIDQTPGTLRILNNNALDHIVQIRTDRPVDGGVDTIYGNEDSDIILGGAQGDTIDAGEADNIIVGDSGLLDFASGGILTLLTTTAPSIGGDDTITTGSGDDRILGGVGGDTVNAGDGNNIVIGDNGFLSYTGGVLTTISSSDPNVGGHDTITTGSGNDRILGGVGSDTVNAGNGDNVVIGDNGNLQYTVAGVPTLVTTSDVNNGGADTITTGIGVDLIFGGSAGDLVHAGAGKDMIVGDNGFAAYNAAGVLVTLTTDDDTVGGNDTIYGEANDDIIIGGVGNDRLDGGTGKDLVFGDNVFLDRAATLYDYTNPRFRVLTGTQIYSTDPAASGKANVDPNGIWAIDPNGAALWTDFRVTMLDTSGATDTFGNDYIAGGAGDDQIFGQWGDDTIQGDGSIDLRDASDVAYDAGAYRDGSNSLVLNASQDDLAGAGSDGDDYIEGGNGNDVVFGNLGQDDIIGGSSNLFSLVNPNQRPDGSDIIFGGSGTRISLNDMGDTSTDGHARDSDTIVGDNGNIYRLVGVNGTVGGAASGIAYSDGFLSFNYDDYNTGGQKIIARAVSQLDYTPGGPSYNEAQAATDIGAADEVHGESGDDFIYVGKGSDVVFGDGQDDNIIGGYGNDWISGGTGDDGIIGDDGRIFTSRNGKIEPLNGVTVAVVPATVATGGSIQTANINVAGDLKKAVDLTPFSTDPNWTPATDEWGGVTQKNNDDIIFGGLGNDFLHGGSGDDAISGAEALPLSYAPTYDVNGNPNGLVEIDFYHPFNPGNALAFNPIDVNGQHSNRTRAGEFALYDEYDPLRKIMLNSDGTASKWTGATPTGVEFFLNFDATQGPAATLDAAKTTDGNDVIFGDLGNDWLVGGSGRDDMYGGFGNDLLNADDNLSTNGGLNNAPDTSASYEDRAYGGAGRDVMIANTGGDRLIDWTGEYNSFLVPFSPFGLATISRTLQPSLMDFLYALSASDGADFTRAADTGSDPARNGEPYGELGLVLQHDAAWNDQHGGPSDPQAGNSSGQRDVLRSANFNSGTASGFSPQAGTFSVVNNSYQVGPTANYGDSVSLFNEADTEIPVYFEMQATINAVKPVGGNKANAFLIYDWQSDTDFKFAGIDVSTNKIEIGHRDASGWVIDTWTNAHLKPDNNYVVMLQVNGNAVTLIQGKNSVSFTYAARIDSLGLVHNINEGMVGIGAMDGAAAQIDDVIVQAPPKVITLDKTVDFGATSPASDLFGAPTSGTWTTTSGGRFVGTATSATAPAVDLIGYSVTPGSMVDIATTLKTSGQGGIVFDYQGPDYYKFVTLSADSKQIIIGHVTSSGTVIDKTFATKLSSGNDYKLGVNLRGGLVNVSLNGAVVMSNLYNETITCGGYGFISMQGANSGQTSFDIIRLKTDDAAYGVPLLMMASAAPPVGATSTTLTAPGGAVLDAIITEAKHRLAGSGLDAASLAQLDTVSVRFDDLDGLALGEEHDGLVILDINAAGYGWFVDSTPGDDREFMSDGGILTASAGPAAGHMDLLTVMAHELGHAAGLQESDQGVMSDTLDAGDRLVAPATPIKQIGGFAKLLDKLTASLKANIALKNSYTEQSESPVINWDNKFFDTTDADDKKDDKSAHSGDTPSWAVDFVNYLGQNESQRNPNADLRVHISADSEVLPELVD